LFVIVTANIEEYIKIVAAGMVGTTPHMISATITALSRLIFEFQGEFTRGRLPVSKLITVR
jgi:ribosomal RNA-processing protein 12